MHVEEWAKITKELTLRRYFVIKARLGLIRVGSSLPNFISECTVWLWRESIIIVVLPSQAEEEVEVEITFLSFFHAQNRIGARGSAHIYIYICIYVSVCGLNRVIQENIASQPSALWNGDVCNFTRFCASEMIRLFLRSLWLYFLPPPAQFNEKGEEERGWIVYKGGKPSDLGSQSWVFFSSRST